MPKIRSAVEFFNRNGVEAVLHCGDFVAPFSLAPFKDLVCGRLYAVFGNNDGEVKGLSGMAESSGWRLEKGPMELELEGRRIVIMHEPYHLAKLLDKGSYDLVASGHLHRANVEMQNTILFVNPGEACGWTSGNSTVAIVDLAIMQADIHAI